MKPADYERLGLARMQLQEFRYGWERFVTVAPDDDIARRYYYHTLMQYLVSFYIADGGVPFFAFMREYGLRQMADEILSLLDRKVGPHSLRQRISDFRDKLLSHPRYDGKVVRALRDKHEADSRGLEYGTAIRELMQRTHALAIGLEAMLADLERTIPEGAEIVSIELEETRLDGGAPGR